MKKFFIAALFVVAGVAFSGVVAKADTFNNNLYYGIRGSTDVSQLQEFLTTQGLYSGPISGNFFSLTLAAVEQFQAEQGITPVAGYFGPVTRAKANAIIDQQIQASNSQALLETSSTPTIAAPTSSSDNSLQAELNALMQELALLEGQAQTQQATTTPITSQSTVASPTIANEWSTYQSVAFNIFQANPNAYVNQNIVLTGLFDGTFLPSSNGTPNYIEIQDPLVVSPPVEIAITSQSDYTLAVNALSGGYEPIIKVYGVGEAMQNFTMTNGTSKMIPVITAQRIDICNDGAPTCSLGTTSIFPTGLSTPSTIAQPAPPSNQNTNIPTSTPTPTTISSPTSNSPTSQCNFAGDVFSCTSDSQITASPTTLPSATIGTNYEQPITISDPNISSQDLRWNIISGSLPPGMGFAFSSSQALECSGTYCFFTAPPAGLSYPSSDAGEFFGTPTATGTYSFTLQAIDDLNYFGLPTFTISIVSSTPLAVTLPPSTSTSSTALTATSSPSFTDIATLDYTNGGEVSGINNNGQIVGTGSNNQGGNHAMLWQDGATTDLGTLGGPDSIAWAINNEGDVVGESLTAEQGQAGVYYPFLLKNGVMTQLCSSSDASSTCSGGVAYAINDQGQIVGSFIMQGVTHAFLWQDGTMTDLGTLPGGSTSTANSAAYGINNAGEIIGYSTGASGYDQAVEWTNGQITALPGFGGQPAGAFGINNNGDIVGYATYQNGDQHAAEWTNGTITDLGTLGGPNSWARAINQSGVIVGYSDTASSNDNFATEWKNGVAISVIAPGTGGSSAYGQSIAYCINDNGQIAGEYNDGPSFGSHGFLYTPE